MTTLEISRSEFATLCDRHGNSIFLTSAWIGLFDDLKFYKTVNKDNKALAFFYVRYFKKMFFPAYRTPLFTPYAGLWIDNPSKNKANYNSTEKKIITEISDFLASKTALISIAFSSGFTDFQPFIWKKFKVIPNYTYLIPLDQSIETISGAMTPERRNDIKKAEKDGITVNKTNDMNIVLSLVNNSLDRQNSNSYNDYIKKILFEFANPNHSFAFVAYHDGKPIATSFCIFDQEKTYYLLGGYDSSNKHSGAGASCIWNSILLSKEMGLKCFDFEGSMLKPIESYFRGFGGNLTPYFTVNKAPFLAEVLLKFFYRSTF
ncbi:MAG: hypothetical protein CVU05_12420 [Bacteroidetes bacterium HGW-Bacteroidetes-21]|jgi:lipid II:glycine glycyltransferase (peptidoglycan interpeptide bridge formation enzyme)|nr:MAG: hypothetical protein CVU05_12420 [Bacteroidetes bacterium HGW-Bacteroidetes-21]